MSRGDRGRKAPRDGGAPDVDVSTAVRAKELRFRTVPKTRVWFEGEPAESSDSETERENLPDEVQPNVTYRDVTVRWSARSRIVHPTDRDPS
ncbi:MAG TPA: hypothetical protein VN752_01620 [Solirubrobacterales bacterium]|nr:hypothetical protein [Solirubrobacterales bacterium]